MTRENPWFLQIYFVVFDTCYGKGGIVCFSEGGGLITHLQLETHFKDKLSSN